MKNETNDGGPAFPNAKLIEVRCPETGNPQDTYVVPVGGMSLRDYLAAKMMPFFVDKYFQAVAKNSNAYEPLWREDVSLDAYRMADAMIDAREGCQ